MGTYMADAEECIEQINAMSKTDFHQRILRGVATSEEFSYLVSIGIKYLTQPQKQHICQMLVSYFDSSLFEVIAYGAAMTAIFFG